MLDDGAITRSLAWARAYLAVGDIQTATTWLRRVMQHARSAHRSEDVRRLAEEIALQHLRLGKVDEAAELLRSVASWLRDPLDPQSDPTVVVQRPLSQLLASRSLPESQPRHEPVEADSASDPLETTKTRFEDQVTCIYHLPRRIDLSRTPLTPMSSDTASS